MRALDILSSIVPESNYDVSAVVGENIGIDDRLGMMIGQVMDSRSKQFVYKIVGKILRNIPERDWDGEVAAIFNWVRNNIRYTRDPLGVELFRTPRAAYSDGIGDCDDMSIILVALLRAVGYICRFRVIGFEKGSYSHVYVVVGIPPEQPERWLALDPSQPNNPGWEVDRSKVKEIVDYRIEEEDKI
jgi:hypothetical protein